MSLTHHPKPQIKIRIDPAGNDDAVQDYLTTGYVRRVLNGIDIATLTLTDEGCTLFNNTIAYGDVVCIYINYAADGTIDKDDLVFYGFVEDMQPSLTSSRELLNVRCRHYGRAFLDMKVSEEYGTESANSGLDEFHEILQDNTNGIIDNYVEEINNDGNSSGYTITDTYIQEDTDTIKYIYFPYTPAIRCLHSLQDVFQALQGASTAGWHWIVKTTENPADTFATDFLLTQVAAHSSGPPDVKSLWDTYWNSTQANSTIVVKQDMQAQTLDYRRAEANYVLYYGALLKPGDKDLWTENNHTKWGTGDHTTSSDEAGAGNVVIGSASLKLAHVVDATPDNQAYYPAAQNAAWDIENWGGRWNIPTINFWFKTSATDGIGNAFRLALHTTAGDYYYRYIDTTSVVASANEWYNLSYPIGTYAPQAIGGTGVNDWIINNNADWGDIDYISLDISTAGTGQTVDWYVDGLHFGGWVMRGAKKLKVGGAAEDYYKQKLIVDDVGKNDSGIDTDDTFIMAQLAYGELLRAARRPIQGMIAIPGEASILPGQLAHIHAGKHSGGFRVDKDMRVLEHRLSFTPAGFISYLSITDDCINGNPMSLTTPMGLVMQAALPNAQDRTSTSLVSKTVDVTQTILEKTYQFNDYY
jgi:hypothetical protein